MVPKKRDGWMGSADWKGYAVAILSVAATIVLRTSIFGDKAQSVYFVVFFPAIIVSSLYGGFLPGLAALALSLAHAVYWVIPRMGGFDTLRPAGPVSLLIFSASSVLVILACVAKNRADQRTSQLLTEARAKEEALREKEGWLRLVTDAAPALICYVDSSERFVFVNGAYEEWFGRPRLEIAGKTISEMLGDQYDGVREYARAALRGEFVSFDRHVMRPDGSSRFVHISYAPDKDCDGSVKGFVAVITDLTKQHMADASLRASERLASKRLSEIDNVYRNAPAGLCFLDSELRFIRLNERLAQLSGLPIEEHLGKTVREVLGARADLIEPLCLRVIESGVAINNHELLLTGPGSEERLIVFNLEPVSSASGEFLGINAVVSDITALRRSELALIASEERYRNLVESASEGIWVIDSQGITQFANKAMARMLGVQEDELPGRPATDFVFPEDMHRAQALMRAHSKKASMEVDFRLKRADGTGLWARCRAQPTFDADGGLLGATALVTDITDRKRAEDRQRILGEASHVLSRSLEYTQTMAELARFLVPDFADWCAVHIREGEDVRTLAIAHTDPEKERWAQELQTRFAVDLESPSGLGKVLRTGIPEFVPQIDEQALAQSSLDDERAAIVRRLGMVSAIIVPLIARGRTIGAITLVTAESKHRYTEADFAFAQQLGSRAAIAIDNARLFSAAQREISERIEAEREIRRLNTELELRVEERTAELRLALADLEGFCYTVSHDLRAPMRSIAGNSMIILQEYADRLDEQGKETLDRLSAAAARMGRLIDDLLQFSRLGRAALARKTIDLTSMALSVADEARVHANEKAEVYVQPDMVAKADPVMTRLVLQNLIENALKYSSRTERPRIEIGATTDESETAFYVKDNGIGFDMRFVDKIFQPFERLHREAEYPGTGIGLANVRRIVLRHGGRVWAEATPGEGSVFYFTLPANESGPQHEPEGKPPIPSYLS